LLATQRVLAKLKVKLAFATHLLEAASQAPRLCHQMYRPLLLPNRPPASMQQSFGLSSAQLRLFLFASSLNDDSPLHCAHTGTCTAQRAMQQQTPLWMLASSEPPPPVAPFPPAFVARFILCALRAVNVWYHAVALFDLVNEPLQATWHDMRNVPADALHFLAITTDSPSYRAPPGSHTWFLHPVSQGPAPANMTLLTAADFHSTRWGLYGTAHAVNSLSPTQTLRIHCFFRSHQRGFSTLWQPDAHDNQLLRLYTQGVKTALASGNLGVWATMVEARVPYLPYTSHPVLQILRGASHIHDWLLSTPAPGTLIYAMVHGAWLLPKAHPPRAQCTLSAWLWRTYGTCVCCVPVGIKTQTRCARAPA
jgi:hypothetical protein